MNCRLTDLDIKTVCSELLAKHRKVTTRQLAGELRRRYGYRGRQERTVRALRDAMREAISPSTPVVPTSAASSDLEELFARATAAERRAELAEERERRHQDLWARRLSDRIATVTQELERRYAGTARAQEREASERYLELRLKIARLERQLQDAREGDT